MTKRYRCMADVLQPMMRAASVALMAGSLCLLVACATASPESTAQMAVSTAALNHAISAGSPEFAPAETTSARDKLARARVAMEARDHEPAMKLAKEAQVDALLAESITHAAKAQKAADELRESRRVLREEIDRTSK
jgi:Domain of unknown function (DUF4398)